MVKLSGMHNPTCLIALADSASVCASCGLNYGSNSRTT